MRADDSPRNAASAGRARRYTSWVRSSASTRSPRRAHTRHTSGWVRRTKAVVATRSPAPGREGQLRVEARPLRPVWSPGTNPPSRATSPPCDATPSARRCRPGSTARPRASTTTAIDAHLGTCRACSAWSEELATLHRMVRVREAEPVPDLSGRDPRHPGRARPAAAAGARRSARPGGRCSWWRSPSSCWRPRPCSSARTPARPCTSPRELGSFDVALAVGLLVAAWQPAGRGACCR